MVDHDVVARKIANASARLADIDRLLAKPREEFLADVERRDLTAFYVQLAIQECIDLASHWLSESDWQPPDDAGSVFDILADHGLISRDLATMFLAGMGQLLGEGSFSPPPRDPSIGRHPAAADR